MTTSRSSSEKITPLFIMQFCAVLLVISVMALPPGPWNGARLLGFCISVPAAVLLLLPAGNWENRFL